MAEARPSVQVTARSSEPFEPTTLEKLRGLRWSIASNAANTVFVQYTFFGSIFVLFLSELGLSKAQMGLLLSLLPFFGLTALVVAPATERFGYKRTYIAFFGLRDIATIGLLFTPWVLNQYGSVAALRFVAAVVAVFSMLRSVGVTAMYPWTQEYVPDSVRGKYTATNNMVTTATGFVAVTIGGVVLARIAGLTGFMTLILVGIVFGLVSVVLAFWIPGGVPRRATGDQPASKRDLGTAIRDRNMTRYMAGVGLITLATVPLNSFLPLFMGDQVGLESSEIVWLQTGTLVGTLLSSYLWGWAADRYGSTPVMLYGLSLRAMLPFFWMLMPRHSPASLYIALAIAFMQGVADMGWGIGSARMLYVNIVPPAKRRDYMAVYYAWIGVVAGISQLSSGRLLELTQSMSGEVWVFTVDPFFPLFVAGIVLPVLSFLVLRTIQDDRQVGMGQFAGIFLRGNPFLAMTSLIRYYVVTDEQSVVRVTEQLGQAKSPLTVDELLTALDDPRFNVRFEAVISISRMVPDRRLVARLEEMLTGTELALTGVAAWALGRIGDPHAIEPLEDALNSDYRSIRAQAARALGTLGATEIVPLLEERLNDETDRGLLMAYASPLGKFQATGTIPRLLELLREMENEGARMELALALARMTGDERHFVQLLRSARQDVGTTLSQALAAFQKRLDGDKDTEALALAGECAGSLARGNTQDGARLLGRLIDELPKDRCTPEGAMILDACAQLLRSDSELRLEYLILAMHTLHTSYQ